MLRKLIIAAIGAGLVAAGAAAGDDAPLTQDQAKRFVATLPALDALGDALEAEGKMDELSIQSQPRAGEEFKPYSNAVATLKEKFPADHARLAGVVKPRGFSTEGWGRVGDRVMIAYLALKMQEEDPRSLEMMKGMDQSMLSMMPPEMRAQLEATFAMLETVKNAPEADKEAVQAVKADLDAYMRENEES